jgi:phenylpyruvate tautomerase PptA (4-oxalocrotonate tautomerase family)
MPLVRISHCHGKPPTFGASLSKGVHRAMVDTFNVPEDDFFQIVTEHARGSGILTPKSFMGIDYSDDVVMVQITCAEGRSLEQKKALYRAIAGNLAAEAGVDRKDVIINLVETKRENWSFGNGLAQFA